MRKRLHRRLVHRAGLEPGHDVSVRRGLGVPMADGVELLANLYEPADTTTSTTVLVRSPYGRGVFGFSIGVPLASQGYRVLIQSCRGTAGSGGRFDPHHDEERDGLATIDWITTQPWYDGSIVTYGPSYLGYTQWAVAAAAGAEVKAMAMQVTMSDFSQMTYAGDSLMLENAAGWTQLVAAQQTRRGTAAMVLRRLTGRPAISDDQWRRLPLQTFDERTTGRVMGFWRDWMAHADPDDPWWQPMNFHRTIPDIDRPITLVSGWHDIFTPWSLRDFAALRAAGVPVRITIGPWTHTDPELGVTGLRDGLDWFARHLDDPAADDARPPVRLFLQGADEWQHHDEWPPPTVVDASWYLDDDGRLGPSEPATSSVTSYRYDPADPTPSLGGPALMTTDAVVDNAPLEARDDVVTFTSAPLTADLDVIGRPSATLFVSSTATSADFFVRLCDVDAGGTSRNVCDGLQRVSTAGGADPRAVTVDLWPTAHRFRAGHRLRVQVSGGAFPRWARNLGTDADLARGTTVRSAEHRIHHGPDHPSRLVLPVLPS